MSSGPTLTEARRHELGYRRLQLRMAEVDIERLDKLAKDWGLTRSKVVAALAERRGHDELVSRQRALIEKSLQLIDWMRANSESLPYCYTELFFEATAARDALVERASR